MPTETAEPMPTAAERLAVLGAEFRRLRDAGWRVKDIAAEYGVSAQTVGRYAGGRPRGKLTPEQRAEVRRLRAGGMKLARIAARFGISATGVSAVCRGVRPPTPSNKLTPDQVADIRASVAAGVTQRAVAARFGVNESTVSMILTGRTWRVGAGESPRRGVTTKLTEDQVRQIRAMVAGGMTQAEAARKFGVNPATVQAIIAGRNWRHVA